VEAELGDLLFTVVNLGRHLGVDAEMALRGCNLRFRERFREMEVAAVRPLEELSPAELEELWCRLNGNWRGDPKRGRGCERGLRGISSGLKPRSICRLNAGLKPRLPP